LIKKRRKTKLRRYEHVFPIYFGKKLPDLVRAVLDRQHAPTVPEYCLNGKFEQVFSKRVEENHARLCSFAERQKESVVAVPNYIARQSRIVFRRFSLPLPVASRKFPQAIP